MTKALATNVVQDLLNGKQKPSNQGTSRSLAQYRAVQGQLQNSKSQLQRIRQAGLQLEADVLKLEGRLEQITSDVEFWHLEGGISNEKSSSARNPIVAANGVGAASDDQLHNGS